MKNWFRPKTPAVNVHVTVALSPRRRKQPRVVAQPEPEIVIPTDLLIAAWRQLFPAERMVVFGGRATKTGVAITSLVDVTEPNPSVVHVKACSQRLGQALIDFDRTGAHFAMWMHSHPGGGPGATHPSVIDLNQEKSLRQHYSERLVSLIAVRDGWIRVWGQAAGKNAVAVRFEGRGLTPHAEDRHVYRLELA